MPVLIDTLINSTAVPALVDLGCTIYSVFSNKLVTRLNLPRIKVPPKELRLAKDSDTTSKIMVDEICCAEIDLDGRSGTICGYIVEGLAHDLILGEPWMRYNDVIYKARERFLLLKGDNHIIRTHSSHQPKIDIEMIRHTDMTAYLKRACRKNQAQGDEESTLSVYAALIQDINKMLAPKKKMTRKEILHKLPGQLRHHYVAFEADKNDKSDLPPNRPGVDLAIELEKDDQGRVEDIPKGPLYGMSCDELLCLRKEITELLDRNWIRASSSLGRAPVLFVKKTGGGLRFCIDYRALNAITRKNRHRLPLLKETFQNVSRARWFTKIDVSTAFHMIRVKEGDKWKTAFQTRLGKFEWLVMPFGLTGAPTAWQRWINNLLRDFLDDFCTAYLDDVFIWSDGSKNDHLEKCYFAVKTVKYLGFIATAEKGISVDPEKIEAVEKWELPQTQTAVRSFLGFANFYRDFIEDFASLSAPLQRYTKKDFSGKGKLQLDNDARQALEKLKKLFIIAPILALFDPDLKTVLETDCSGWAMGGCLSQWDSAGKLRPVGYFSKKLLPCECNYDIHDKELLAIIRSVEFWRSEIISLKHQLDILTDHKNLQYFSTKRTLSERQIRWKSILDNLPNIKLHYRPGKEASRPDAFSRLEQDAPKDPSDPRLRHREQKLLNPSWIALTEHSYASGSDN
ncbi:hypothetical protein K3495_g2828 [Podosphaera aphanis]|nr:hypothetical protein K3495_g2828 [Podosphaera aphanis]